MRFTADNFYQALERYAFEDERIKSSLLEQLEECEPTHFFIYEEYDENNEVEAIDLVFCNTHCYNIAFLFDTEYMIFDYSLNYGVNIKILEEKLDE